MNKFKKYNVFIFVAAIKTSGLNQFNPKVAGSSGMVVP